MNFRRGQKLAGVLLVLCLCVAISAQAQIKEIRLRNERIHTAPPDRTLVFRAAQDSAPPVSGLFLVQFTERFNPAWRGELLAHKTELLRYVPDDAFVARLDGVRLDELRALPFVQWVGEYRPEHKLHALLSNASRVGSAAAVTVLLSPTASPAEIIGARTRLERVQQESKSRFGTVLRGRLAAGQLARLSESPAVLWIEPAPQLRLNDEISSKIVAGTGTGHATFMQDLGFDGSGVTVAVADSGLHLGIAAQMHQDLAGRTPVFLQYGSLTNAADEHAHGTHVSGIIAGSGSIGTVDSGASSTDWASRRGLRSSRNASSTVQATTKPRRRSRRSRATRCNRAPTSARTVGATTRRAVTM